DVAARDVLVADCRAVTLLVFAAQLQAQGVGDQRAAEVQLGGAGVAVFALLLQRRVDAGRASPLATDLLGDDVDHPTHGVGAIQGRHRAANDFDALDSRN